MRAEETSATSRVEIRSCRQSDLAAIVELLAQAKEAASWSMESLQPALEQDAQYFFVAAKDAEVVGFITGRTAADEGEVLNLAVRQAYRREGLGKALVQSLLQAFRGNSVATVFLEVRESNRPAIAFYDQLGFTRAGWRPEYYSNPSEAALVLRAKLGQRSPQNSLQSK